MNKDILLSRLEITGEVDETTPKVVLQEIADVHGIPYPKLLDVPNHYIVHEDFLNKLRNSPKKQERVSEIPLEKDLPLLVNFINSYVSWDTESLLEAFDHLQEYMGEDAPLPDGDFSYGHQIPSDPTRLNACVLYKICKTYHLPLRFDHTLDQMASAVRMLARNEKFTRPYFYSQIRFVDTNCLPSLYLIACRFMNSGDIPDCISTEGSSRVSQYEEMKLATEIFTNPDEVLLRVAPSNSSEAMVLAAKNFKIDLTSCSCPVIEYKNLLRNRSTWEPMDSSLKKMWKDNPLSFRLDIYFNPQIPHELYENDDLVHMALVEGYTSRDLRSEGAYSLLETAILSSTFYHGKHPTISNDRTPITWKKVRKLSPNSVICFGTLRTKLIAFSYDELAENILRMRNFTNPLDTEGHPFPELAIRKLKRLTRTYRKGETKREIKNKKKLMRAIELGELFTQEVNNQIRDFYLQYESFSSEDKETIRNIIWIFFRLSMFTRGWDPEIDEVYPITLALVSNQHEVDLRVTQGIRDLEEICSDYEDLGNLFLELPLVLYRGGWTISSSAAQGTTIRERLQILKSGETIENQNSCMRITSNWFASSAYRYMIVVGMEPPFDIEKLRNIS